MPTSYSFSVEYPGRGQMCKMAIYVHMNTFHYELPINILHTTCEVLPETLDALKCIPHNKIWNISLFVIN